MAHIGIDQLLITAIGLHLGQALVEGGHELLVLALADGRPVGGARLLLGHGLQPVALGDAVGQDRVVVDDRLGIAGLDHLIHGGGLVHRLDREAVLGRTLLGESLALAARLDGHYRALQILVAVDLVVVLGDGHLHAGVEIGVGEVVDLLALVGDGHAGYDHIGLLGVQGLEGGVEAQGLDLHREPLDVGDLADQIHIDTDQLAGRIPEFEGGKGGVGGDTKGASMDRLSGGGVLGRLRRRGQGGDDQG